jgi:hypothetical protein
MPSRTILAALATVAASWLACGSSSTNLAISGPAQACIDTASAIATTAQRCGADYQQNYDAAVNAIAGGDCNTVTAVRDEAALRGTCLPSLGTISCTDFQAVRLDASCASQLQRPAPPPPMSSPSPASAFAGVLAP